MDINLIMDLAKEINIAQLIVMGGMLWFGYSRLDNKIEKLCDRMDKSDLKIDNKFERSYEKTDDLRSNIQNIDKRLCRLEGAFSAKECCMIKDDRQIKKVE